MRADAARWIERALLVVGVGCLGYYGYMSVQARHFQREQTAAFLAGLDAAETAGAGTESTPVPPSDEPTVLALLEIPRLSMSTAVVSGAGPSELDLAVGHLPDTPMPWERGNSAFAAHRDGLFRPLKDIRVGDHVRVRTRHGDFTYRVRGTRIVNPDDLTVLAPTSIDTLTLITCYPFYFVGHAPKRFIVQAERESAGDDQRKAKNRPRKAKGRSQNAKTHLQKAKAAAQKTRRQASTR